jgi:hypothetical protein
MRGKETLWNVTDIVLSFLLPANDDTLGAYAIGLCVIAHLFLRAGEIYLDQGCRKNSTVWVVQAQPQRPLHAAVPFPRVQGLLPPCQPPAIHVLEQRNGHGHSGLNRPYSTGRGVSACTRRACTGCTYVHFPNREGGSPRGS